MDDERAYLNSDTMKTGVRQSESSTEDIPEAPALTFGRETPPRAYSQNRPAGEVYEFWSDLIPGEADKADAFLAAFREIVEQRELNTGRAVLAARHLFSRERDFEVFDWGVTKAALHVGQWGKDLYVSWRLYVASKISPLRILGWVLLCLLAALVLAWAGRSVAGLPFFQAVVTVVSSLFVIGGYAVILIVITGALGMIYGHLARNGDVWALWREGLDEFHKDDVAAVAHFLHRSVLLAATAVGIDPAEVAPRAAGERSGALRRQQG